MNDAWDPEQYGRFSSQRARPFHDLMRLIQHSGFASAVDLGCGTGELTRHLFDRFHPHEMVGIDSSNEMLEESVVRTVPGLRFELRDIADYQPEGPLDLVFSNAALQWVPDHEFLFPKLLSWMPPGGQLAIQMPCNFDHPSHQVARRVALKLYPGVFASATDLSGTLPVERYAEILFQNGCEEQVCRVEVYGHPMASGVEVVEWTRGALLTLYRERLSDQDFASFVACYQRELIEQIGDGPYFYAFKRMLLWGKKG